MMQRPWPARCEGEIALQELVDTAIVRAEVTRPDINAIAAQMEKISAWLARRAPLQTSA
jgi:hypothetical protein